MSIEVGTKWYKAPELLYCCWRYTQSVDIWSAGCILAELMDTTPVFTGQNDMDQISKIAFFIGKPDPERDSVFLSEIAAHHLL